MIFELTSQILIATVIDSDPEFIQMNFENGQLPLEWPSSFLNATAIRA